MVAAAEEVNLIDDKDDPVEVLGSEERRAKGAASEGPFGTRRR